jgi:hypothetical protein
LVAGHGSEQTGYLYTCFFKDRNWNHGLLLDETGADSKHVQCACDGSCPGTRGILGNDQAGEIDRLNELVESQGQEIIKLQDRTIGLYEELAREKVLPD